MLLLNAHAPHALVSIRSLGTAGHSVTAGSATRWNAGRCSRHVQRYLTNPDPATSPAAFLDAIAGVVRQDEYDMLLPVNERTVDLVVANRSRFDDHTAIPFQSYDQLSVGLNKRHTAEAAREAGIPHPRTRFSTETTLEDVVDTLGYPIVVKPEVGSGSAGVTVCETPAELEREAARLERTHDAFLFQEFIPNGGERGVYTLYDESSSLVGLTVQHRLRTYPPDGGPSTYRETVADQALVSLTDRFLTGLEWTGLAMAEYRIDARTGTPTLIDLNPRLWGSLALSTFAGVDFPVMLYDLWTGNGVDPATDYAVGVRARNLCRDAARILKTEDRLHALGEFLTPSPAPCRYDVVAVDDPLPILGELAYGLSRVYQRVPTP